MATSYALPSTRRGAGGWLRNPAWDLTFISLSAVLVALPYSGYYLMTALGLAAATGATIVDLVVTLLIGGPHMYATFTRTIADPNFRANHRRIIATSILIPIAVIVLGFNLLGNTFPILLTIFFFWASVHVLHQIVFLVECYNRRAPRKPTLFERGIDYAVVMTSLYPLAMYRLVHGTFDVSGITLPFPDFLKHDWVIWAAGLAFAVALALFLAKTVREVREGRAHWPKLLLIGLTVIVSFFLPGADRLDAAFQGFNTWHSFQYLGLIWYANRLASDHHQQQSSFTQRLSGPRDTWRYYGAMVLCTVGAGLILGVLLLLRGPLGLTPEQPYYITVLSFLLVHYYHDHVLFTHPEAIVAEASA
ncbi:MAG: hypothetical protein ACJ8CR_25635 [Roseiflexaceae bacterium]